MRARVWLSYEFIVCCYVLSHVAVLILCRVLLQVEGRFPPKKSQQDGKVVSPSSSSSLPLALDQETLAQAALLQQMKERCCVKVSPACSFFHLIPSYFISRFGPNDCLKAMMMLVSSGSDKNLVEQMEKTLAEMKQKNS